MTDEDTRRAYRRPDLDPGIDQDPALGDTEDPAEDPALSTTVNGGLASPMTEISGEDPDPTTVNQLPVSGGVNWQPPSDPVTGYGNPRDRERASELPRDVVPNGR